MHAHSQCLVNEFRFDFIKFTTINIAWNMIIAELINYCLQQASQQTSVGLSLSHIQLHSPDSAARMKLCAYKREFSIAENVLIKERKPCATNKRKINCTINMYNKYGVGAFALWCLHQSAFQFQLNFILMLIAVAVVVAFLLHNFIFFILCSLSLACSRIRPFSYILQCAYKSRDVWCWMYNSIARLNRNVLIWYILNVILFLNTFVRLMLNYFALTL